MTPLLEQKTLGTLTVALTITLRVTVKAEEKYLQNVSSQLGLTLCQCEQILSFMLHFYFVNEI